MQYKVLVEAYVEAGLAQGQIMAAKSLLTWGKREPEMWRPPGPRLGTLWLHDEAGHVTCGMVVEQHVGNSIQASGSFTLNKVYSYLNTLESDLPCPRTNFNGNFESLLQQSSRDTHNGSTENSKPPVIFTWSFNVTAHRFRNSLPSHLTTIKSRSRFVWCHIRRANTSYEDATPQAHPFPQVNGVLVAIHCPNIHQSSVPCRREINTVHVTDS